MGRFLGTHSRPKISCPSIPDPTDYIASSSYKVGSKNLGLSPPPHPLPGSPSPLSPSLLPLLRSTSPASPRCLLPPFHLVYAGCRRPRAARPCGVTAAARCSHGCAAARCSSVQGLAHLCCSSSSRPHPQNSGVMLQWISRLNRVIDSF